MPNTSMQASSALTSEAAMDQQVVAKVEGDDAGLFELTMRGFLNNVKEWTACLRMVAV